LDETQCCSGKEGGNNAFWAKMKKNLRKRITPLGPIPEQAFCSLAGSHWPK